MPIFHSATAGSPELSEKTAALITIWLSFAPGPAARNCVVLEIRSGTKNRSDKKKEVLVNFHFGSKFLEIL